MSTETSYEIELRLLYQRLDHLACGFEQRLAAWIERAREESVYPDPDDIDTTIPESRGAATPSLESFLDQAVMIDGGIGNGAPRSGVLDYSYRPMPCDLETGRAHIQFLLLDSDFTKEPACKFIWHNDMHNQPDGLATIANNVYLALRQLAPSLVEQHIAHGILAAAGDGPLRSVPGRNREL